MEKPPLNLTRLLLVLLVLVYPAIVYFGLAYLGPALLASILVILLALRLFFFSSNRNLFWPAIAVLGLFLALVWFTGDEKVLRAYPVFISVALFAAFGGSLLWPPPIIERLVRLRGEPIHPAAIPYMKWVTFGWSCFFLVNAALAACTAWLMPIEYWAVYNGLVSYVLIAILFAIEYIIRRIYQRRVHGVWNHHEPGN